MTRRIWSAALALSMAGGVYLAAPAQASNMGFKLERDVDYLTNAAGAPLRNIYWVGVPLYFGIGDVAATLGPETNKCVGETNGPAAGDNWISVDDLLCDWWEAHRTTPGAEAGTFAITWFNRADCIPKSRAATFRFGNVQHSGDIFPADDGDGDPSNNTDIWTDIGYQVNLTNNPTFSQENRLVIVGSHDPSSLGHGVSASAGCGANAPQVDLLGMYYHTMFRKGVEIICGLEGVDWIDDGLSQAGAAAGTAADGMPDHVDECDTQLFDGTNTIAVSMFFNDEIVNGPKTCSIGLRFGQLSTSGCPALQNFDITPGEGYLVNVPRTHIGTTTSRPPHF